MSDYKKTNDLTEKTTPVDADLLRLDDSADSFAWKKATIANVSSKIQADITTWNVSKTSSNGVVILYTATASTNAARGVALLAAVAAATSGDRIYVRSGTYDCADLYVDGVYYYFEDGAIVNYTGETNARIFDISSGSGVLNIDGYGQFLHQGNDTQGQVIYSEQSATVNIRCKKIQSVGDVAVYLSSSDGMTIDMILYADEVLSYDGTFDMVRQGTGVLISEVHVNSAYSGDGSVIECDGGDHKYYIDKIESGTSSPITVATEGDVKVYGAKITSLSNQEVSENTFDYDNLELYNCEFNTAKDVIFEGKASVYNCRKTNDTELKSTTSIKYLSANITNLTELSADPANPVEGNSVMWQSDGTGAGGDGDIMMKITAGGVTKTITLADYSEL